MTKYEIIIRIEKLWGMCQYWTLNRAFLVGNPNVSRENLNDTYGLTEDDKEFFFLDYMDFVSNQLVLSNLWQILKRYNKKAWSGKNIKIEKENDKIYFYITAKDDWSGFEFQSVLYKYLQFKILWWWYKLKNKDEVLPRIELAFAGIENELLNAIINSTGDDSSAGKILYHDGFVNRKIEDPAIDTNYTIVIDDGADPEPPQPPQPIFQDDNNYQFSLDLPPIIDDLSTIKAEVSVIDYTSESSQLCKCLWKIYQVKTTGEVSLLYNETIFKDVKLNEQEPQGQIDFLLSEQGDKIPASANLDNGDKIFIKFFWIKEHNGESVNTKSIISKKAKFQIAKSRLFTNTFAIEYE